MSRSRKKTPVSGSYTSNDNSEKEDKRIWHRRMRAAILARLYNFDPDEILLPHENEICGLWNMSKDGKHRFDPREYPKLMRK